MSLKFITLRFSYLGGLVNNRVSAWIYKGCFDILGNEAITSRLLIVKLMEKLSSYGYFVITGLDITRKTNDKSLLLFQRGAPLHAKFMCLSLNESDKIRLINAPNDVNSVS